MEVEDTANTLVQGFTSSRPDYCNAVLYGISDNLYQRLQSVTVRLIRDEHITTFYKALPACPTPGRMQARHAHIQNTAWSGIIVSVMTACDTGRLIHTTVFTALNTGVILGTRILNIHGP